VPGAEGDFTVLPLHAPVIALLRPGVLRIPGMDGNLGEIYVRGGIAEVGPERLTILAEQAIPLSEVDRALIAREIKDAEDDLAGTHDEFAKRQAEETLDRLRNLSESLNLAA
jgi:F-type H+-transporting ATPase subunit epsilon